MYKTCTNFVLCVKRKITMILELIIISASSSFLGAICIIFLVRVSNDAFPLFKSALLAGLGSLSSLALPWPFSVNELPHFAFVKRPSLLLTCLPRLPENALCLRRNT